jgi:hydrogenase expression/formation protein HypC
VCLGVPGRIVEFVDEQHHVAEVEVSGARRKVNVGLLATGPETVAAGDWVLIHLGFALSKIGEDEARETIAFLEALEQPYEQELAELG